MAYTHRQIQDGIYHIGDGRGYFCTLLVGDTGAILYDTMMGMEDLKDYVAGLTDFEPMVINIHCHFDHVGGNYQFDKVYMGEGDFPLLDVGLSHIPVLEETQGVSLAHLQSSFADKERISAIAPSTVIDLGRLTVEVLGPAGPHTKVPGPAGPGVPPATGGGRRFPSDLPVLPRKLAGELRPDAGQPTG